MLPLGGALPFICQNAYYNVTIETLVFLWKQVLLNTALGGEATLRTAAKKALDFSNKFIQSHRRYVSSGTGRSSDIGHAVPFMSYFLSQLSAGKLLSLNSTWSQGLLLNNVTEYCQGLYVPRISPDLSEAR